MATRQYGSKYKHGSTSGSKALLYHSARARNQSGGGGSRGSLGSGRTRGESGT